MSAFTLVWLLLSRRVWRHDELHEALRTTEGKKALSGDPATAGNLLAAIGTRAQRLEPAFRFTPKLRLGTRTDDQRASVRHAFRRGTAVACGAAIAGVALIFQSPLPLLLMPAIPWAATLFTQRSIGAAAQRHVEEIDRDVIGALDVFILALEAGLSLERAISQYVDRSSSSFALDLRETQRELDLGYRRRESLERLAERTGSDAVGAMVRRAVLAEELGTPLADGLRGLTGELRALRRQRLQAASLKAPVTMLVPTALFILLPIFAIVLGPIAIRVFTGTMF